MTGWRKRQVIDMAREADLIDDTSASDWYVYQLERFAELVRADEAEKYKWDVHSCGPTCTKVGCVAVRKAVEAEREACAKLFESHEGWFPSETVAAAIRARGEQA